MTHDRPFTCPNGPGGGIHTNCSTTTTRTWFSLTY